MRTVESYSELECLVLGLIAQGANSGYAMRKRMQRMHGNRWSVDSGSVYRALRRLSNEGLVDETARLGVPNRQRIEYQLSNSGQIVLRSWLCRPPTGPEMAHIADSIRTRSYFLELMEASARTQTVKSWIVGNKRLLDELKQEAAADEGQGTVVGLARRSLILQAEARQEWLKKLAELLKAE